MIRTAQISWSPTLRLYLSHNPDPALFRCRLVAVLSMPLPEGVKTPTGRHGQLAFRPGIDSQCARAPSPGERATRAFGATRLGYLFEQDHIRQKFLRQA